jgi:prepilin-type N-terminal cleavage/methylation domain-containing protein
MKIIHKTKGFSLVEIIISIAVLAIVFSFIFYFVSTINLKNINTDNKPFIFNEYNYSNKYCYFENGQFDNISIVQDIDMSQYISTSTIITSINIFHKDRLIITTNSASTSESDIFIFHFNISNNQINLDLISSLDVGPGINDALLHDNFLYILNTSVNSHVKIFKINPDNNSISFISNIKIDELSASYSLPKKIYLYDKNILIGSEKNNNGGELFVLSLDTNNILGSSIRSIEVGGQVSDIYGSEDSVYIANASDIELFVYDKDFNLKYSYDAPLSLGNGKSVYYLNPYIFLGRTVSSFELFFIEIKDGILSFINKYKTYGSIDFIQDFNENILIISNSENKELQFLSHDMSLSKTLDLPSRVNSYNCSQNSLLISNIINNQSHILWLR